MRFDANFSVIFQRKGHDLDKWGPESSPSEAVRHGGVRRTKNLQGERERKGRKGKVEREEKEKREEKRKRKEQESKRERCVVGVKHHLRTVKKTVKDTEKGGEHGKKDPGKR